jgi:L-threonylcarbamoyladenylate synthase
MWRGWRQAREIGEFGEAALTLARRFWPGPLTLVVPKRAGVKLSALVTAGLETVGIRVPDH